MEVFVCMLKCKLRKYAIKMTQSFKSAPSIFTEQPAQDKEATNDDNISDTCILKDLAE